MLSVLDSPDGLASRRDVKSTKVEERGKEMTLKWRSESQRGQGSRTVDGFYLGAWVRDSTQEPLFLRIGALQIP